MEDPESVTAAKQLVGEWVIEGERLKHDRLASVAFDVSEAVVKDREVTQTQEVHLEQTEGFTRPHVELRDNGTILLATPEWHHVDQGLAAEDDTGCVNSGLALESFEPSGRVDHLANLRFGLIKCAKFGGLTVARVVLVENSFEADVLAHHRRRHRLGDAVAQRVRMTERPRRVLDGRLRLDRTVRDDLRHVIFAVRFGGVANHVGASTIVEVDVNIGHRDALGVEEPLEQQPVCDGVEFGNSQSPGDDRSRRGSAAGTYPDAVLLGMTHKVGHHEEVAREPHLDDDAHLVGRLLAVRIGHRMWREPPRQPSLDLVDEPRFVGVPLGHGEAWHEAGTLGECHLTPFGDQQGVVTSLGKFAPHLAHFCGGFEVEVAAVKAESVGVIHRGAGSDAQQHVVHVSITRIHVMQIVGGEERKIEGSSQAQQIIAVSPLDTQAVIH